MIDFARQLLIIATYQKHHWKVLCVLDAMESIVDGVNVDIVEKIALGLCASQTFKARITSAPGPTLRQFKGYLVIDIHNLAPHLLIIRDSHIFPL